MDILRETELPAPYSAMLLAQDANLMAASTTWRWRGIRYGLSGNSHYSRSEWRER